MMEMGGRSERKFVGVGFGNVVGRRGRVIGIFKKEIEEGGGVRVREGGMRRYFMRIGEG